ncbi:GntR family transcriptional regulator [Streptomyces chartreusis]|uniref:GntR family transcriptional regulator n=1 Tax=Streptomyces chartreusis TaxID=1969 RepID=UPI0038190880
MPGGDHIERAPSMYMQVARRIATDIRQGFYGPDDVLPSETQMMDKYGVGRHTVRSAMAELRRTGLVESRQGKGSIVLRAGGGLPATSIDRSTSHTANHTWHFPRAGRADVPTVTRTTLTGPPALLLGQEGLDAIKVDRSVEDPTSGARWSHCVFIPMATIAAVPALAEHADAEIDDVYQRLGAATMNLSITDHVTARSPYPEERAAFALGDAIPLLITYRVATDVEQGRPLLCEELKASAATCWLSFPIMPTPPAPTSRSQAGPAGEDSGGGLHGAVSGSI